MIDWAAFQGWDLVLPPNRPDKEDMDRLRVVSSGLPKQDSACLLGSTPEYRVVLRDLFEHVYIIDKSDEFKAVSDAICGSDPCETYVKGDWLEVLPDLPSKFDLIASHFTHGNIAFSDRRPFFLQVSQLLRTYGVFYDVVFNPPRDLFTIEDLEASFRLEPPNSQTLNLLNAKAIFQGAPIAELGYIDSTAMYEWLLSGSRDRTFLTLVERTTLVTPRGLRWDYDPIRPPETLGYLDYFNIRIEVPERPESAFADAVRLLISEKRIT